MAYRFDYTKYPDLLEKYQAYRKLELKATGYSMKDSKRAGEQLTKANQKSSEYAYSILAKAIYEIFAPIKPVLHKRHTESEYISWDEVFDKPFDDLDIKQRKYLVGLLDNFVYELPLSYYND
mgnify:CR=1 FL=1